MNNNIRYVIDEIKEKLPQYMELCEQYFSLNKLSDKHRSIYQQPLSPPIPIETIESFESAHKMRFPDGFRLFLSEVGSGAGDDWEDAGVGPDMGIVSVKIDNGKCNILEFDITEMLVQPFPFTEAYNLPQGEELYAQWEVWNEQFRKVFPPYKINADGKAEYITHDKTAIQAYCDEHGYDGISEYYERLPSTGIMPICGIGCGDYYFVIITGEAAGEVWIDCRNNWGGYEPVLDSSGNHIDFAEWYLQWLNEAINDMTAKSANVRENLNSEETERL
ncbi:MAG: hypothetical protein FWD71_15375 [Oscillospiraceae bacterium]|nr:hypothetical protein [Oscillospiraceae bacterium]